MMRALELEATCSHITASSMAIPLLFAWSRAEYAPLLLGQFNFLEHFDICIYRSRRYFEVNLAGSM